MADDKQFANVPQALQGKMERCVLRVKASGKSKSSAIAICFESVVRGKDIGELIEMNSKERRIKRRREARALETAKEKKAADKDLSHDEQMALAKASFDPDPKISQEEAAEEIVAAMVGETEVIEVTEDIGDVLEFEREEKALHLDEEEGSSHSPTSFSDLDKVREAAEEAGKVQAVIHDYQHLVSNVIHESEPDEIAGKVSSLTDEFGSRIDNPPEIKEVEKKGIFANLKEKVLSGLEKAKLTRSTINNLSDSSFAFIEAGGKKDKDGKTTPRSLRHFPIHDAVHVRNALARAAQGIKKGGGAAENARRALPKIKAAVKRLGIGSKKSSTFQVFKDKDGFRWFGSVSNKWRDRDWPAEPELGGQIITEEAHKEFVLWVDENLKERMPRLWPWHTIGGQHKQRADWIDYADGFLLMSGPLTETEAELLINLGKEYDLAMSHGLVRSDLHYDKEHGLIEKYRTFEASYLPREFAANEWTDIITIAKEVAEMGFTPEKRTFLERVLGEEKVVKLEEDTENRAKELDELGVEWKDLKEVLSQIDSGPMGDPEEKPKEEEEKPTPNPELEIPAKEFEGLSEFLEDLSETTKATSKAVVVIGEAVVRLSKSDDEKIAAVIRPKVSMKDTKPVWQRSASGSKANEIDEDKKEDKELADSKPGVDLHWMEEVLGAGAAEIAPIPR